MGWLNHMWRIQENMLLLRETRSPHCHGKALRMKHQTPEHVKDMHCLCTSVSCLLKQSQSHLDISTIGLSLEDTHLLFVIFTNRNAVTSFLPRRAHLPPLLGDNPPTSYHVAEGFRSSIHLAL